MITPPAPPPPAPEVRTPRPGPAELGALLTAGWERALVLGSLAFLAVALLGEALGFVVWAAARTTNSPLGVVNAMRIGGFYFFGFHHIGISFSGDVNAAPFSGRIQFGFAVALLLATAIAGWLLYRFGRRVANSIGGGPAARAAHGAKVAVPYALLSLILSFIVPFRIPTPLSQPSVHAGVGHGGAFVLPLVLGLVAGGFGGLLSLRTELEGREGWGRQALTAIVAGWRMFLFALLFSFGGLLVLAALHPDLTSSVVRGEIDSNGGYGATMVNHVLVLPNQSMWVLVPAMGGCDGAFGGGGPVSVRFDFLCYWHFPMANRTTAIGGGGLPVPGALPTLPFGFGTAPPGYFLFLLVPAGAVLLGGAEAARRRRAQTQGDAILAGVLAGVVYGVFVGIGSWLAGIGVSGGGGVFGIGFGINGTIGPRIGTAILIGLGWGVIGGAVGAALRFRRVGAVTT